MESEDRLYMIENRFYFPEMTWDDYDKVLRALAGRTDNIVSKVMYGELELKPVTERTREYIFNILGIAD